MQNRIYSPSKLLNDEQSRIIILSFMAASKISNEVKLSFKMRTSMKLA